jgi:hypothetical protein
VCVCMCVFGWGGGIQLFTCFTDAVDLGVVWLCFCWWGWLCRGCTTFEPVLLFSTKRVVTAWKVLPCHHMVWLSTICMGL